MSRHAAGRARAGAAPTPAQVAPLSVALLTVAVTGSLTVTVQLGRTQLAVAVGIVQALLTVAWVVGTALPGRIGSVLIGLGVAGGAEAAMLVRDRASLAALLAVLASCFLAMIVHQLSRGVVRVRVAESLAGVAMLATAVAAFAAYLALARAADGTRLVSAAVLATGLGLLAAQLVDAVLPVPRFTHDVPHGLLGVGTATAAGVVVGAGHSVGARHLEVGGGVLLGALTAAVAALVTVAVGYLALTVQPRRVWLAFLAVPYLRVGLPFGFSAPVAYLIGLYAVH